MMAFRQMLARLHAKSDTLLLLFAMLFIVICLFKPHLALPKPTYQWFIVLDITQSMNVRDYKVDGRAMSRLHYAKQAIRTALRKMPCGTNVALSLFTERNVVNIVRPLEVCKHFAALDETVAGLDWRMAWSADSFISHGLFDAITQSRQLNPNMRVLFITDGQQAPPANPKYMPKFEGEVGAVKGVILGAGQLEKSPIPKLDAHDNITGYWALEDVQRYATFGMARTQSALEMEQQRDYKHGRNAPHGAHPKAIMDANLSGVDTENLTLLATETGLRYQRLDGEHVLADVTHDQALAFWQRARTDLRPLFGLFALLMVILYFLPGPSVKSLSIKFSKPYFFRRNR